MILWTPGLVEDRLRQALVTLRRMPGRHVWPAGMKTNWPDFVRSYAEAYGYSATCRPRVMATAREIAEMDEALGWLSANLNARAAAAKGLPRDVAQIVWMRAGGVSWTRIMEHRIEWWGIRPTSRGGRSVIDGGNSYVSIKKAHAAALDAILGAIGGDAQRGGEAGINEDALRLIEEVEALPMNEERVVMQANESGELRPVVRTTHYRARSVIRARRRSD